MNNKEQILAFAKERGIEHFIHFTNVLNLPSILSQGLLPRSTLDYNLCDYIHNDDLRLDGLGNLYPCQLLLQITRCFTN